MKDFFVLKLFDFISFLIQNLKSYDNWNFLKKNTTYLIGKLLYYRKKVTPFVEELFRMDMKYVWSVLRLFHNWELSIFFVLKNLNSFSFLFKISTCHENWSLNTTEYIFLMNNMIKLFLIWKNSLYFNASSILSSFFKYKTQFIVV